MLSAFALASALSLYTTLPQGAYLNLRLPKSRDTNDLLFPPTRISCVAAMGGELAGGKAAQQAHASTRNKPQPANAAREKTPVLPGFAAPCEMVQFRSVEAAGIEPASRGTSAPASTCVACRG